MKKILLLGFGKIAYMPYMNLYLDNIIDDKVEFDLIYWNRDGRPDVEIPLRIRCSYMFEAHLEEQIPFREKIKYFYNYRKFVLNILKHNSYDKIIVLHTTPGLTLLDYLIRHYKGRYLLDFRDISYEYIPIYRSLVGALAKNSKVVLVSSSAFRKFLPKKIPAYTVHNYLNDSLNYRRIRFVRDRKRKIIRIRYWGLIRQAAVNEKMMNIFGNDTRFELHYHGRMQQAGREMELYARQKNYRNIFFHGTYMPKERYEFALNTDILHNVYDIDPTTGNAMGNKYYDGIIFGIPQICAKGSHMGDTIEREDVGFTIDLNDTTVANRVWNYYQALNWNEFDENCDLALNEKIAEQKDTVNIIRKFCCGEV